MEVKHRKCAVLHGKRTGITWSGKDITDSTQLVVQDSPIPIVDKEQSWIYLGFEISLTATSEEEQVEMIVDDLKDIVNKIGVALLAVAAKLRAVNITAMFKLHFYYLDMHFTDKELDSIEDTIVSHVGD